MTSPTDFDFSALLETCRDWGESSVPPEPAKDPLLERIRQVLGGMKKTPYLRWQASLIPLLRHVLLRRGGADWVRLPNRLPWPTRVEWEASAFVVLEDGDGFQIQASHPRLPWLSGQADLFDDAFAGVQSGKRGYAPGDPFLMRAMGLPSYNGPGQREAVRALLQSPRGKTIIANLPTGTGKSLLAQLPPLLNDDGRLTLVIVPTTALAIDQAQRMTNAFLRQDPDWPAAPLAYHGGSSQENRSAIFQAIRDGRQRILFTSPECATGSLRAGLEGAASRGLLGQVFIDEAHLVIGWGNGFRPAFQLLAAMTHRLRELAPPETLRVVLASATLTLSTTWALRRLFRFQDNPLMVAAVHLRPEPRYAFLHCQTEEIRSERVLEAIRKAPRPFILYVTRPDEAEAWAKILKVDGHARVAAFHGKTPSDVREALIKAWSANALDGMVATSAFGLGMDKDDVRTIIHATLPESVDRFYQEVGRSGRDGIASTSLLLFTDQDVCQATGLAWETLIGDDNGFERWSLMIDAAKEDKGYPDIHWIALNHLPPHLNMKSKANINWNIRTINLMARAGLIELVGLRRLDSGNPDAESLEFGEGLIHAAIRIRENGHRQADFFAQAMQAARAELHESTGDGFERMRAVAFREREISETLRTTYSFIAHGGFAPVSPCCGGCPQHWQHRQATLAFPPPHVPRLECFAPLPRPDRLLTNLSMVRPNILVVVVPAADHFEQRAQALLEAMLGLIPIHTVALERGCSEGLRQRLFERLQARNGVPIFLDSFALDSPSDLQGGLEEVRLLIWGSDSPPIPPAVWGSQCALQIMLVRANLRDFSNDARQLIDTYSHVFFDNFMERLTR